MFAIFLFFLFAPRRKTETEEAAAVAAAEYNVARAALDELGKKRDAAEAKAAAAKVIAPYECCCIK